MNFAKICRSVGYILCLFLTGIFAQIAILETVWGAQPRHVSEKGLSQEETSLQRGSCETISYYQTPNYYWSMPSPICDSMSYAQRFTFPSPGILQSVNLLLYDNYAGFSDNSGLGIDIIVSDVDSWTGMPGYELGRMNILANDLNYNPIWTVVDISSIGLTVEGDVYIGLSVVDQVNDNIAILSNDGTDGDIHSSSECNDWWTFTDPGGGDFDFLIETIVCYCGDANTDNIINIFDITFIIGYLYLGGPPPPMPCLSLATDNKFNKKNRPRSNKQLWPAIKNIFRYGQAGAGPP